MRMIVEEGRVYGSRYWTVHPVISLDFSGDWGNIETWNQMMAWMVATFGPSAKDGIWTPGQRWYANNAMFYFRNEQDRDWFLLRWQ